MVAVGRLRPNCVRRRRIFDQNAAPARWPIHCCDRWYIHMTTDAHETLRSDDASLAAALLAGEPWAPTRAWGQLSPSVLGFLRRYFGPGADHEDLCQEVFVRFFARISELRVPHALRSFLIGICLGVAQNERRRAKIRRAVALTATGELPDMPASAADHEGRQAVARLCQILTHACPEDRGYFIERYVRQMELSDIATSVGRPLGTVKRRVAVARRRIDARIQRDPALAPYAATPATAAATRRGLARAA